MLYDTATFPQLLNRIILHINDLGKRFPATEARTKLVVQEVAAIADEESLERIANIAKDLDSLLYTTIKGQVADVLLGDEFSSEWRGGVIGRRHNYSGLVVEKGAKVHIGNKYGGKDFWDD